MRRERIEDSGLFYLLPKDVYQYIAQLRMLCDADFNLIDLLVLAIFCSSRLSRYVPCSCFPSHQRTTECTGITGDCEASSHSDDI